MKATAEYRPDCASSISLLPTNGGLSPLICRCPARASLSAKIAPTSLSWSENQATLGLATPIGTGGRPERPRTVHYYGGNCCPPTKFEPKRGLTQRSLVHSRQSSVAAKARNGPCVTALR